MQSSDPMWAVTQDFKFCKQLPPWVIKNCFFLRNLHQLSLTSLLESLCSIILWFLAKFTWFVWLISPKGDPTVILMCTFNNTIICINSFISKDKHFSPVNSDKSITSRWSYHSHICRRPSTEISSAGISIQEEELFLGLWTDISPMFFPPLGNGYWEKNSWWDLSPFPEVWDAISGLNGAISKILWMDRIYEKTKSDLLSWS